MKTYFAKLPLKNITPERPFLPNPQIRESTVRCRVNLEVNHDSQIRCWRVKFCPKTRKSICDCKDTNKEANPYAQNSEHSNPRFRMESEMWSQKPVVSSKISRPLTSSVEADLSNQRLVEKCLTRSIIYVYHRTRIQKQNFVLFSQIAYENPNFTRTKRWDLG